MTKTEGKVCPNYVMCTTMLNKIEKRSFSGWWIENSCPPYHCNFFDSLPVVYLALDNNRLSNILSGRINLLSKTWILRLLPNYLIFALDTTTLQISQYLKIFNLNFPNCWYSTSSHEVVQIWELKMFSVYVQWKYRIFLDKITKDIPSLQIQWQKNDSTVWYVLLYCFSMRLGSGSCLSGPSQTWWAKCRIGQSLPFHIFVHQYSWTPKVMFSFADSCSCCWLWQLMNTTNLAPCWPQLNFGFLTK